MEALIKPLKKIVATKTISLNTSQKVKRKLVEKNLNKTKWKFVGFLGRSSQVVLQPKFHNVRDNKGRFATVQN